MPFIEKRLSNPTTLSTAASTVYTVPAQKTAIVKQIVVTNTTSNAATFSLSVGSDSAANTIFSNTTVAGNDSLIINLSQVLNQNEILTAKASANTALNFTASGVENDGPLAPSTVYLADESVTTSKLSDLSVTNPKLANGSVSQLKIADNNSLIMRFATTTARDAAFGGTGEPTLAEGMTCYIDADNSIYTYDGSSWVKMVSASTPPGLELITTKNIGTASTGETVTDAFSSQYDIYEVMIAGGVGSLTTGLNLTIGSANANYYMARSYVDWISNTYGDTSINNGAFFATAGAMTIYGLSFGVRIVNPFLASRTTIQGQFSTITPSGEAQLLAGFLNDTNSYTSFTITTAAGTMTGGTIYVYGYRQ